MLQWIEANQTILWWLAAISVVIFVGTIAVVPWIVVRLPRDYFTRRKHHSGFWHDWSPAVRMLLRGAKNVLGVVFLLMGIVMLVLPGQGILTMVVGVVFVDFPGKYRLQRWLATRRSVLRTINWLRRRAEQDPLVLED